LQPVRNLGPIDHKAGKMTARMGVQLQFAHPPSDDAIDTIGRLGALTNKTSGSEFMSRNLSSTQENKSKPAIEINLIGVETIKVERGGFEKGQQGQTADGLTFPVHPRAVRARFPKNKQPSATRKQLKEAQHLEGRVRRIVIIPGRKKGRMHESR